MGEAILRVFFQFAYIIFRDSIRSKHTQLFQSKVSENIFEPAHLLRNVICISLPTNNMIFSIFFPSKSDSVEMTMTEQTEGLPKGKYTFVGIDVDATGRRILDEVNFGRKIDDFFLRFLSFFLQREQMDTCSICR